METGLHGRKQQWVANFRKTMSAKTDLRLTPEYILSECCKMFGIPEVEISGRNRKQEHVVCRAFIAYFIREKSNLSLPRIGLYIGRDHSNITHLLQTIDVYLTMDILYHRFFESLAAKFSEGKPLNVCPMCGQERHL